MLRDIYITNPRGETLKIDITRPDLSGIIVNAIEGLGPGKSTISTVTTAVPNVHAFQGTSRGIRNIVFSLLYDFTDGNIEEKRLKTYRFFPIGEKITMRFVTDSRHVITEGYVESNVPVMFSSMTGTSISIVCPDPNLYSYTEYSDTGAVVPDFEFEFSNESISISTLVMSSIVESGATKTYTIDNTGDKEIGIVAYIGYPANSGSTVTTIRNTTYGQITTLNKPANGRTIRYSSIPGKKGIRQYDTVTGSEITGTVVPMNITSAWVTLKPGRNVITITDNSATNVSSKRLIFRLAYEGV